MHTQVVNRPVDWRKYIDRKVAPIVVTEEVREETKRESVRHRSNVRLALGLFYTDAEFAEMRREELSHELP